MFDYRILTATSGAEIGPFIISSLIGEQRENIPLRALYRFSTVTLHH